MKLQLFGKEIELVKQTGEFTDIIYNSISYISPEIKIFLFADEYYEEYQLNIIKGNINLRANYNDIENTQKILDILVENCLKVVESSKDLV